MAFMMHELKTMISVPNVNEVNEIRKRSLWAVLGLLVLTFIPVAVCYFMPQYRTSYAAKFGTHSMFSYVTFYLVSL
jgi:hypothetical protein